MNKARRTQLKEIIERLESIKGDIFDIANEEESAFDNLPESLQESSRGEAMQEAFDDLNNITFDIDDVIDRIENVINPND